MAVSAGIGAVGAIAGGVLSSRGASQAANSQIQAASGANAANLSMFDNMRQDLDKFKIQGYDASNWLGTYAGLDNGGNTDNGLSPLDSPLMKMYQGYDRYPDFQGTNFTNMANYNPYGEFQGSPNYQAYGNFQGSPNYQAYGNFQGAEFSHLPGYRNFNPTMRELENTPGYQFIRDQGMKATTNKLAAAGLSGSGPQAKALMDYSTGLASTTYQQQLQNYMQQYQTGFNSSMANYTTDRDSRIQNYNTGQAGYIRDYTTDRDSRIQNYNTGQAGYIRDYTTDRDSRIQNYNTGQAGRINDYNTALQGYLNQFNTRANNNRADYTTGLGAWQSQYQTGYNAYTQNQNNVWNKLYQIIGLGQNSAAQTGATGVQVGGQIGQNMIGAGNAAAAGTVGSTNALTGAITGVGNNLTLPLLYNRLSGSSGGAAAGGGASSLPIYGAGGYYGEGPFLG